MMTTLTNSLTPKTKKPCERHTRRVLDAVMEDETVVVILNDNFRHQLLRMLDEGAGCRGRRRVIHLEVRIVGIAGEQILDERCFACPSWPHQHRGLIRYLHINSVWNIGICTPTSDNP
jgi:hypothetical protein